MSLLAHLPLLLVILVVGILHERGVDAGCCCCCKPCCCGCTCVGPCQCCNPPLLIKLPRTCPCCCCCKCCCCKCCCCGGGGRRRRSTAALRAILGADKASPSCAPQNCAPVDAAASSSCTMAELKAQTRARRMASTPLWGSFLFV